MTSRLRREGETDGRGEGSHELDNKCNDANERSTPAIVTQGALYAATVTVLSR